MKFRRSGPPLTNEELSSVEAELKLRFPRGLRDQYLQVNGGYPEPSLFRRGEVDVEVTEFLPLERDGRGLSAVGVYRLMALQRKLLPLYFFPFAIDGGGNLFLVDCRFDAGPVYVWWLDVSDDNLLDLRVGIADFWSSFIEL